MCARDKPTIVLIDDALHMDGASWGIAEEIGNVIRDAAISEDASKTFPFMLVVAVRPFEHYIDSIVLKRVPEGYKQLCYLPSTEFLKVGPLTEKEGKSVVCRSFDPDCADITDRLWRLVKDRCNVNPLILMEFAKSLSSLKNKDGSYALLQKTYCEDVSSMSGTSGRFTLDLLDSTRRERSRSPASPQKTLVRHSSDNTRNVYSEFARYKDLPLPHSVSCMFGSRIDHLTPFEQLVLKFRA